jgi:putative ABC transport system permease protein
LVILTITVGVFAVGFVSNILFIGVGEMDADYQSVNPHGAILYTDPFTEVLLPSLQKVAGVGQLEGRSVVNARAQLSNGQKRAITITGIPTIEAMQIDRLRPQVGVTSKLPPLGKHEIYIEQTGLIALPVEAGDPIEIELFDGSLRSLRLAAVVHDVASFPSSFGGPINFYATPETIKWLGGSEDYNRLYLTVAQDKTNEKHVKAVAQAVADQVEKSGREVYFTFIYQPGRHFASSITQSLTVMMMFFGLLSVLLGSFLVINTVNGLLGQQVRQIGVMKAVGAKTGQLMGMYLALVACFGLVALAISIPLGLVLSHSTGGGLRPLEFQTRTTPAGGAGLDPANFRSAGYPDRGDHFPGAFRHPDHHSGSDYQLRPGARHFRRQLDRPHGRAYSRPAPPAADLVAQYLPPQGARP